MSYEKISGILVFGLVLAFVSPIVGVLFGALAGWIVGLAFDDAVLGLLRRCGVDVSGLTMWQLGAGLGFVGSYLKTTVHSKDK